MSIFLAETDRVIVQSMTGSEGRRYTTCVLSAGTKVVVGVNPRRAGTTVALDAALIDPGASEIQARTVEIPVYDTVVKAKEAIGAEVSVVFVPPALVEGAIIEAVDAGARLLIVITESTPVADATWMRVYVAEHGVQIIGPNCPSVISPTRSNVGITPSDIIDPGPLGLVFKSGTLTYWLMRELSDLGFIACIGIGGDPVISTTHTDALAAFEADPDARLVVMIGGTGGDAEERAAAYIREHTTKPVIAYVVGFTTSKGRTMGHASTTVSGSSGTAEVKRIALETANVRVGCTPSQTAEIACEFYRQLTGEVST